MQTALFLSCALTGVVANGIEREFSPFGYPLIRHLLREPLGQRERLFAEQLRVSPLGQQRAYAQILNKTAWCYAGLSMTSVVAHSCHFLAASKLYFSVKANSPKKWVMLFTLISCSACLALSTLELVKDLYDYGLRGRIRKKSPFWQQRSLRRLYAISSSLTWLTVCGFHSQLPIRLLATAAAALSAHWAWKVLSPDPVFDELSQLRELCREVESFKLLNISNFSSCAALYRRVNRHQLKAELEGRIAQQFNGKSLAFREIFRHAQQSNDRLFKQYLQTLWRKRDETHAVFNELYELTDEGQLPLNKSGRNRLLALVAAIHQDHDDYTVAATLAKLTRHNFYYLLKTYLPSFSGLESEWRRLYILVMGDLLRSNVSQEEAHNQAVHVENQFFLAKAREKGIPLSLCALQYVRVEDTRPHLFSSLCDLDYDLETLQDSYRRQKEQLPSIKELQELICFLSSQGVYASLLDEQGLHEVIWSRFFYSTLLLEFPEKADQIAVLLANMDKEESSFITNKPEQLLKGLRRKLKKAPLLSREESIARLQIA